jgi:hypothetical protein
VFIIRYNLRGTQLFRTLCQNHDTDSNYVKILTSRNDSRSAMPGPCSRPSCLHSIGILDVTSEKCLLRTTHIVLTSSQHFYVDRICDSNYVTGIAASDVESGGSAS